MSGKRKEELRCIEQEVRGANLVLVGLGEEVPGARKQAFCKGLVRLLEKKDYFLVSLWDGREELTAAGLLSEQMTFPLAEEGKESWERYLHWLSFTLNQKLCILELGVGFARPQIIRFPFEKTCYFNQKARMLRIHPRVPQLSEEIAGRGISIQADPVLLLAEEDRE
ncbi:MAG: hypothetical protein HFI92_03280 [Lachnospiraceae bacterium]|nr:hypothetical protein [Lachnospiraceae bacterium]